MEFAFYFASGIAVVSTLRVITNTNPVHALLYLIISLIAVAMTFSASVRRLPVCWKSLPMRARSWSCSCLW